MGMTIGEYQICRDFDHAVAQLDRCDEIICGIESVYVVNVPETYRTPYVEGLEARNRAIQSREMAVTNTRSSGMRSAGLAVAAALQESTMATIRLEAIERALFPQQPRRPTIARPDFDPAQITPEPLSATEWASLLSQLGSSLITLAICIPLAAIAFTIFWAWIH